MADEPRKEEKAKASPKVEKLVAEIAELSVLELSDLVSALQEKLGVSAAPAALAAPAAGTTPTGGEAAPGTEGAAAGGPATQTVVLTGAGANKIGVIKALREVNPNLGLKDAKDMTEKLPAEVVKDVKAEEAAGAKQKLEAAGATVELK